MPSGAPIAGVKDCGGPFDRRGGRTRDERRPEARVDAEIDECSTSAEDAARLGERPHHIVEIGVRQDRDDRIELPVLEREGMGVAADEPRKYPCVLPSSSELIGRDVRSHNGPAGARESWNRTSRSAAEIEAAARPWSEQLHGEVACAREHVGRRE